MAGSGEASVGVPCANLGTQMSKGRRMWVGTGGGIRSLIYGGSLKELSLLSITKLPLWGKPARLGRMKPAQKARDQHIKTRAQEPGRKHHAWIWRTTRLLVFSSSLSSRDHDFAGKGGTWQRVSWCWNLLLQEWDLAAPSYRTLRCWEDLTVALSRDLEG